MDAVDWNDNKVYTPEDVKEIRSTNSAIVMTAEEVNKLRAQQEQGQTDSQTK